MNPVTLVSKYPRSYLGRYKFSGLVNHRQIKEELHGRGDYLVNIIRITFVGRLTSGNRSNATHVAQPIDIATMVRERSAFTDDRICLAWLT